MLPSSSSIQFCRDRSKSSIFIACGSQRRLRTPPTTISDNLVSLRSGTVDEACDYDQLTGGAKAIDQPFHLAPDEFSHPLLYLFICTFSRLSPMASSMSPQTFSSSDVCQLSRCISPDAAASRVSFCTALEFISLISDCSRVMFDNDRI